MVDLKTLFKDYVDSRAFSSLVNLLGPVDDHSFQTKDGGLLVVVAMRGADPECKEDQFLDSVANTSRSALSVFGERFVVNSFLLKRSNPALESVHFRNPVADEASKNRHALFMQKGTALYVYDAFLTITIKPEWKSPRAADRLASFWKTPFETFKTALGTQTRIRVLDADVTRSLRLLHRATNSFLEQTAECLNTRLLTKEEAFLFFRRLLNPDPAKAIAVQLTKDSPTDSLAVDSECECYRDHLRLDNYFVKSLTLKQLPSRTFANILSKLSKIKADLALVTEWSVVDTVKALAEIRSKRRHAHNTKIGLFSQIGSERPYERELLFDESKEAAVSDLGECLKAIEMRGIQLGEFSLTVLILAHSIEEAERATAEVMKVIGSHDGALNEERYNGLNAFLAALPGGYPYNLRKNLVTNENHADMVSWFQPAEGERTNSFLRAGHLAAFETEDRSLYFFNLHVQDVGHALILGPTGSGKSFLLNFLITHAQQYDPYTFIFDVGGSYRWLTELLGGSYVPFRPELRSFSINPFCLEPTPGNLEFLFSFCKLLVESDGHQMTDAQERDLLCAFGSAA